MLRYLLKLQSALVFKPSMLYLLTCQPVSFLFAGAGRMSSSCSKKLAVIFDYDYSLINVNSDVYIFEQLLPDHPDIVSKQYANLKQWTKSVDSSLQILHEEKGCDTTQMLQCVARVPVQDGMLEAVCLAAKRKADLFIVSDANTEFINVFLQNQKMESLFQKVVSNKAILGDRLHVLPYHDFDSQPPHGCPNCPPNMCKGAILKDELSALEYDQILYVGDGGGDYCAGAALRETDTLLVRKDFALEKKLTTHPVRANVRTWSTGQDVLEIFTELLM